jgi:hypothetical protein
VVIDPGDDLGLGAVGQPGSIDDVQLPQRHRRRAPSAGSPAAVGGASAGR